MVSSHSSTHVDIQGVRHPAVLTLQLPTGQRPSAPSLRVPDLGLELPQVRSFMGPQLTAGQLSIAMARNTLQSQQSPRTELAHRPDPPFQSGAISARSTSHGMHRSVTRIPSLSESSDPDRIDVEALASSVDSFRYIFHSDSVPHDDAKQSQIYRSDETPVVHSKKPMRIENFRRSAVHRVGMIQSFGKGYVRPTFDLTEKGWVTVRPQTIGSPESQATTAPFEKRVFPKRGLQFGDSKPTRAHSHDAPSQKSRSKKQADTEGLTIWEDGSHLLQDRNWETGQRTESAPNAPQLFQQPTTVPGEDAIRNNLPHSQQAASTNKSFKGKRTRGPKILKSPTARDDKLCVGGERMLPGAPTPFGEALRDLKDKAFRGDNDDPWFQPSPPSGSQTDRGTYGDDRTHHASPSIRVKIESAGHAFEGAAQDRAYRVGDHGGAEASLPSSTAGDGPLSEATPGDALTVRTDSQVPFLSSFQIGCCCRCAVEPERF